MVPRGAHWSTPDCAQRPQVILPAARPPQPLHGGAPRQRVTQARYVVRHLHLALDRHELD
jgi:hypothetical protein